MKREIENIEISPQRMAEYQSKVEQSKASIWSYSRYDLIKKYYGGKCAVCSEPPTKKVVESIEGAQIISRYCASCFERITKEGPNKYKDKVTVRATNGIDETIALKTEWKRSNKY